MWTSARRLVSRRTLLGWTSGMGIAVGSLIAADSATRALPRKLSAAKTTRSSSARDHVTVDEYEFLRNRWADILIGESVDSTDSGFGPALSKLSHDAGKRWAAFDITPDRAALWPDLPIRDPLDSAAMRQSFDHLRTLATAYRTPGTAQHDDPTIRDAVLEGIDWLYKRAYHEHAKEVGNWFHWEIAVPQAIEDICILLYPWLDAERCDAYLRAIDRFVPTPDIQHAGTTVPTGANRSDRCRVLILRGILGRRPDKIAQGRNALYKAFAWSHDGDGLRRDGSYIQHHNIAYTGAYGLTLLEGVANLFALFTGSSWELTDTERETLYVAATRTFAPVIWNGLAFDAVRGRAIAASDQSDHSDGRVAIAGLLRLADGAPPADAARYRTVAKGWIKRSAEPFGACATVARVALARTVMEDPHIPVAPEPVAHQQFPDMDRVVHRRPHFAYVIAMSSARIARYEGGPNYGQNLHGWHTGAGMTYLYLEGDRRQFADGFWPTVDPYRLPGTTVDTLRLQPGDGAGDVTTAPWVGGACLDSYGVVGMELQGCPSATTPSTLRAKKSWFCLGDRVVALGAGITSSDGRTIETTIENRHFHRQGSMRLVVDGQAYHGSAWRRTFAHVGWAHLSGVGGYVLLDGSRLHVEASERTGYFRTIDPTDPATDPVTRRFCTLWLDHGRSPNGARYAYLLLPGADPQHTAAEAERPGIQILANSDTVQAVVDTEAHVTAANFFRPGAVPGLSVDGPASVVVREQAGELSLAVSDPSRTAASVTVELRRDGYRSAQCDPGVTVVSLSPSITVRVDVGGSRGASHTIRLRQSATG